MPRTVFLFCFSNTIQYTKICIFLYRNSPIDSEIDISFHLIFEFDCDCKFFIYLLIYLLFLFLCLIVVQIEYFSGVFQTWASSSRGWRFFFGFGLLVLNLHYFVVIIIFKHCMFVWSMFVSFINCPFKLVDFGSHWIVWCPFFKISDLYTTHIEIKNQLMSTTMLQISKHIRIVNSLLTCSNNAVTWDLHLYC